MSDAFVEIRDYTIEAEWFDRYKEWAVAHAAPWLLQNLDVIDFWLDAGIDAEVAGSAPQIPDNGQPNVCWIIRWASKAARDEGFPEAMGSPEWAEIWSKHPNPNAYLQTNVRFMRAARAA